MNIFSIKKGEFYIIFTNQNSFLKTFLDLGKMWEGLRRDIRFAIGNS